MQYCLKANIIIFYFIIIVMEDMYVLEGPVEKPKLVEFVVSPSLSPPSLLPPSLSLLPSSLPPSPPPPPSEYPFSHHQSIV